jgi:hypothetical protein
VEGEAEKIVLVLGARASLAEAKARRPKRDREHPPLDATFFRRVRKYRRNPALFNRVQVQATKLDVPDLARSDPPVGLGDYIGRVYFNIHHNPVATATSAYFQMIDLYAWEVSETTNWMIGRSGPIKKVLQKEIFAGHNVSVVTFNIDMLIENALQELVHSRPGAPWCLQNAYGFSNPLRRATTEAESFDYDGEEVTIPLYKMHGSLNWVFRHRDFYPPADLVSRARQVWQLCGKRVAASRTTLHFGGSGRATWYGFPLIIPPVYEKHAFIRTARLRTVSPVAGSSRLGDRRIPRCPLPRACRGPCAAARARLRAALAPQPLSVPLAPGVPLAAS